MKKPSNTKNVKTTPIIFYSIKNGKAVIESNASSDLAKLVLEYSNFEQSSQDEKNSKDKVADAPSQPKLSKVFWPGYGEVYLVKLGSASDGAAMQSLGGIIGRALTSSSASAIDVLMPKDLKSALQKHAEALWFGINKGMYKIEKVKKETAKKTAPKTLNFVSVGKSFDAEKKKGKPIIDGINLCRHVANLPGNLFRPEDFRSECSKLADAHGFEFKALDIKTMHKLGMGCFTAVASGSSAPAFLNILRYVSSPKAKTVMLVGKGLTFDTGGYSLKPAASMEEMKFDMCGGAAVLGAMEAIGRLKPKVNVVALIPSSENLINGQAMKPGDIFQAYNGKTVEVINTDAEGRLILCDALAYGIKQYKPQAVVDMATLTGACMVALGKNYAGLFSNHDGLTARIQDAANRSGDRVWRLPLGAEYKKDLESPYADLKNVGSRYGGAITAACFLEEFVDKTPWAHIDIAGVAWDVKNAEYYPAQGATGFGVHLAVDLIMNWTDLK